MPRIGTRAMPAPAPARVSPYTRPRAPARTRSPLTSVDTTPSPARAAQRQAVAKLGQVIKSGHLKRYLAAEDGTGVLTHPEAPALFAALPTLTGLTTAKDLVEVGLIEKVPDGLDEMWGETPRYFVGRQVLVDVPVDSDHKSSSFHFYKEDGEVRTTHHAHLVGESGSDFLVQVAGRDEPLSIPKRKIFAQNEGHYINGTSGTAWGVDVDYANDPILKAKICAAMLKLRDDIGAMSFDFEDAALVDAALESVPAPTSPTPVLPRQGKMVSVSGWTQDAVGRLDRSVASPLKKLFDAVGGNQNAVGPTVQRLFNTLVDADGAAKDLSTVDWAALAKDLQIAVAKDATLATQRKALKTLHGEIQMEHPASVGAKGFGSNYRPPRRANGEAGKLANGGIGVCNLQASVLFALMQPFKHVLGYETQLDMGACIHPRASRSGGMNQNPPHGWVTVSMWPTGERFISDRTWHHPCLSLDYAYSVNGDRRHRSWDPKVSKGMAVMRKDIDMSGEFMGAKPVVVGDVGAHGRPDH